MAAATYSDESLGEEKQGMHMRRGSDAEKKYQDGARASVHDVKDHGLEIMDKMGAITMSMGAMGRGRHDRSVMGFIADESTCAGFALAGALETGIEPAARPGEVALLTRPDPKMSKRDRASTIAGDLPNQQRGGLLGKRNYFVVTRGTIDPFLIVSPCLS